MESILISISMILKILWTVFCKIIIWNKNIKLLIFFTTYSTVEFYFWKRKNEGKEDSWQISARAIWKKMVRCLKRRRKINGYIRCPSVTANFFYFLNKSTELDHPPALCFVNPPSSTTYLTRAQRTYLQAFLLLSQETELGPLEFTSFPSLFVPGH